MIFRSSLDSSSDAEAIAFHGELDAASAPDLKARLGEVIDDGQGSLLVDLTNCTFIDSMGMAVVVECQRALAGQERAVVLAASGAQVRRLLGLAGIDEVIPVYRTREEAAVGLAERE